MVATLYNGVSGIKTHQFGLDSLSNNIANVNTNGFRGNIPQFSSVFAKSLDYLNTSSTVSSDFEHGATVSTNAIDTSEGSYENADNSPLNVALKGDGWFVVGEDQTGSFTLNESPVSLSQKNYFTRDGQFLLDGDSYLVNGSGHYVYGVNLGKLADDGTFTLSNDSDADQQALTSTTLEPIRIPDSVNAHPTLTTEVDIAINLSKTQNISNVSDVFYTINSNDPTAIDLKTFDETAFRENDMNTLFNGDGDHLDLTQNTSMAITMTRGDTTQTLNYIYGEGTDTDNVFYFTTVGDFVDKIADNTGLTVSINPESTCVFEIKNVTADGDTAEDVTLEFSTISDDLRELGITTSNQLIDLLGITQAETVLQADNAGSVIITEPMYVPTYQTNMTVYDDEGTAYIMQSEYYLTEWGGDQDVWDVATLIYTYDQSQIMSSDFSRGTLSFDSDGTPTYVDSTTGAATSEVSFADQTITFNPVSSGTSSSTNQIYKDSSVIDSEIDGNAPGFLEKISIDGNGIIYLQFTNNIVEPMGRLGLANFVNDQGLSKAGGNLFEMNYQIVDGEQVLISGLAESMWNLETGNLINGSVMQGMLETSNVNFSSALTELIVMQRGYSASAKTFTTGDELIKEAINLKK